MQDANRMGGRLGGKMESNLGRLRKSGSDDDPLDEEVKESELNEQYNLDDESDTEGVNKIMQGSISHGVY